MHVAQRKCRITGTGGKDKTAVIGILERGGNVRTTVIDNRKKKTLHAEVIRHVEAVQHSTATISARTMGSPVATHIR